MKIDVNENRTLNLTRIYIPIALTTENGEEMGLAMRDSGFEIVYCGHLIELKEGKLRVHEVEDGSD
jgi:hypothetical protein